MSEGSPTLTWMSGETLRILVTVKAYPEVGRKHGETVCVAGIDVDAPRWVRLFPVPFRDMPFAQRFRKFDIVEVNVHKASDPRPESFAPDVDSVHVVGHVDSNRPDERRAYIEPLMRPSMCQIRRDQVATRASLGVFSPATLPELLIDEDRAPRDAGKQMIADQTSMLMPSKKGVEKIPYRFSYRYRCAGEPSCNGHQQSIIDWEIGEAFRMWRDKHGEEGALERIRSKWTEQMWSSERDAAIFTGNQVKYPDGFLVLGVFWPPRRTTAGGSSGPVQGELLPPR